jgi:hypothetical protein
MSTYKSFTLNAPSDPAPWGTVENQAWKDCIDTLCVGTVAAAKDVTYGHKHKELCYNDPAVPVMLAVASSQVEIYSNTERPSKVRFCASHADQNNNGIICDTAGLLTVNNDSGALALTSGTVGGISINSGYGNVALNATANITLTPASSTGRIVITTLPTSSAGLTAGMLWNNAGTVKII